MPAVIIDKIKQARLSLNDLKDQNLKNYDLFYSGNPDKKDMELLLKNMSYAAIHNIASLKDYFKEWCNEEKNGIKADDVIDKQKESVAVIHDLWNINKHRKLNSKPRSGTLPKIINLRPEIILITKSNGYAIISQDSYTGAQLLETNCNGDAYLYIHGDIVDSNNKVIGKLYETCEKALHIWEDTISKAGINIPEHQQTLFTRGERQKNLTPHIETYTKYNTQFENAEAFRQKKDYKNAIDFYTSASEATKKPENFTNALFYRSLAKEDNKDLRGSLNDYNLILQHLPTDSFSCFNRALIKEALGDIEGAIDDYSYVIKLNSTFVVESYVNRGSLYDNLQKPHAAIKDYDNALKLKPNDSYAFHNRGLTKLSLKKYNDAINDFTSALTINPLYTDAYINRACAKITLYDFNGAIKDCKLALSIEPKSELAHHNLNVAYSNLSY
jgi:tetratricopeptide (TPR) repeat protein